MMSPLKAPTPVPGEQYQAYLQRLAGDFQRWANQPVKFSVNAELVALAARENRSIDIHVGGPTNIVCGLSKEQAG